MAISNSYEGYAGSPRYQLLTYCVSGKNTYFAVQESTKSVMLVMFWTGDAQRGASYSYSTRNSFFL